MNRAFFCGWTVGAALVACGSVARIGTTDYATLADAIRGSKAGDVIELTADVEESLADASKTCRNPICHDLTLTSAAGTHHAVRAANGRGWSWNVTGGTLTLSNVTLASAPRSTEAYDSFFHVTGRGAKAVFAEGFRMCGVTNAGAHSVIHVENGATLEMRPGAELRALSANYGQVRLHGTKFAMTGGVIADCLTTAGEGAPVYVYQGGLFEMSGGVITNCAGNADACGAVFLHGAGDNRVKLTGGRIVDNLVYGVYAAGRKPALRTLATGTDVSGNVPADFNGETSGPDAPGSLPEKIVLPGGNRYRGHLQGVCTDGRNIYWSMTFDLIKTDLQGRELAHYANAAFHIGDLCWRGGRVYAGINRTAENGCRRGDEVWVFDTRRLERVKVVPTPQTVWCNNGIEWYAGRFWIISCTPTYSRYNYVFEYMPDFRFVQCRPIESGWTHLGVQTICLKDDVMYFGCYGAPNDPQFPHRSCLFGVSGADLTRRSNNAEFPYVVPIESRFDGSAAEGIFVLGGKMWVAHGSCTTLPAKEPGKRPPRLFGASACPYADFENLHDRGKVKR